MISDCCSQKKAVDIRTHKAIPLHLLFYCRMLNAKLITQSSGSSGGSGDGGILSGGGGGAEEGVGGGDDFLIGICLTGGGVSGLVSLGFLTGVFFSLGTVFVLLFVVIVFTFFDFCLSFIGKFLIFFFA